MESFGSSPNYMKATSSFDSNKEHSPQGGSECADMISVASSTCGSSVNGPYAPKPNRSTTKHRTNKSKTIKNIGNVKSFRKRAKSRIIYQSPVTISDEESLLDSSDPSPHYLKETSSSQCKKLVSEVVSVTSATHSSTLKGSSFPEPVNLHWAGAESETKSLVKVCRYHHCSLHGHCHGTHDPVFQTKRFLYKRRRSLKKQKSFILKIGEKHNSDRKKNVLESQTIPIFEQCKNGVDSCDETRPKPEDGRPFGDEYEDIREWDFIEVAFGETSYPERSYQESLDISRKYSLLEQEFGGNSSGPNSYRLRCSFRNEEQVTSDPGRVVTAKSTPAGDLKDNSKFTQVNDPETDPPPTQEGGKLQFSKQRHISMWRLIHQHMSPSLAVEPANASLEGERPLDSEDSLLARRSTSSGGGLSDSEMGTTNNDSENEETQLRKMFAIKLVREAIEKILLPEVQDQTSDDQSVTSESTPRTEILGRIKTEDITGENLAKSDAADTDEGNVSSNPKQESPIIENTSCPETNQNKEEFVRKSEKKAPKHWSNLKKWILLQRFIRELEKVKKFNPKKPQILPLNPDPEVEKVNLRPQTVEGRKNAEEWMLDYAIRQAVGQLAPTQKRKVALLVKAFETVAPTKEEPQVQYRTPKLKSDEPVFQGHRKDSNNSLNSVYFDGDSVPRNEITELEDPQSEKSEPFCSTQSLILDARLEKITANETEGEPATTPQDLTEDATVEGNTEESGSCIQMDNKNHIEMWHMIYQHVVSGIAEKVGSRLLDGSEDDEVDYNISPDDDCPNNSSYSTDDSSRKNHVSNGLTKSDALKLVKEAVDEILLPETQDDSSDTQSERNYTEIGSKEEIHVGEKAELPKAKNWRKLKNLILLKRSIKALEKAREVKPLPSHSSPQPTDPERDEKNKAEQWMLDYAVRHIVTKLTPARKKRVSMLVEAFEAVVPLPEM